ncbi:MAG: lysozyme inhibitor LprI family protein [Phenylobacterium sp.]
MRSPVPDILHGRLRSEPPNALGGAVVTSAGKALCAAVLLAVTAVWSGPASAQHISSAKDCQGLANVPTGVCFEEATKKAEAEMHDLLVAARAAIDDGADRKRLDAAQQAWLKYRNLTCGVEGRVYFGGGSGQGTAEAACREAVTLARISDLHAGYDWAIERDRR